MKFKLFLLFCFIWSIGFSQLPKGFVYVDKVIPDIQC